jgi:hypothetical protein
MVRAALFAFVVCSLLACSRPQHAAYPGWEPTSPIVPQVKNRRRAIAALEASRKAWLERGWDREAAPPAERELFGGLRPGYAYVRALQVSDEEVEFTLLVVENGRVVERSLLSSRLDASGLGDRLRGEHGSVPKLHWREALGDVGKHAEGAPPLTIDALYDLCRDQVLRAHPELTSRLSFQMNGVLQHCGFLIDECPECPAATVLSVGRTLPRPWQRPQDLVCNDRPGLVVAGDRPWFEWGCEMCDCLARNTGDPRAGRQEGGLGDICKIDPRACPEPDPKPPEMGTWSCKRLLSADCIWGGGSVDPHPMCTGRPVELDGEWQRRCARGKK